MSGLGPAEPTVPEMQQEQNVIISNKLRGDAQNILGISGLPNSLPGGSYEV
jgi:hypothetical protein